MADRLRTEINYVDSDMKIENDMRYVDMISKDIDRLSTGNFYSFVCSS